jgi:molybdate transport system substrate-binding protein
LIRKPFANELATAIVAAASCLLLFAAETVAGAAEIKLLSPGSLRSVMSELVPEFEKSSGHKITIDFGEVGALAERIRKGEAADIAIVSRRQIEDFRKEDKIVEASLADLVRVGVGVAVRKGAAKPDVSSVEALKRALLDAKAIAYSDPASGAASGIYVAGLLDRLGIAGQLKPKVKLITITPGGTVFDALAKGEVELQFGQISVIIAAPEVDLVGPLPAEIQNYTVFAAGIVTGTKQQEAGKALIRFLSSPAAAAVMRAKGLEPG